MNDARTSFGYVVAVDSPTLALNLHEAQKGSISAHRFGVSDVLDSRSLFGVEVGARLLICRVVSVQFEEPREVQRRSFSRSEEQAAPLRQLRSIVLGVLERSSDGLIFTADALAAAPLGAQAYPLTDNELIAIWGTRSGLPVTLGTEVRFGTPVFVDFPALLSRHVAVLGSTGQGKSCFTAAILQQLIRFPGTRVVLFDVNGEYSDALLPHLGARLKVSKLGMGTNGLRIPYTALGRHGISRLLLPSERTQRPALSFALNVLSKVRWFDDGGQRGVGTAHSATPTLFDDARPGNAEEAKRTLNSLTLPTAPDAAQWPSMRALACLIAESQCVVLDRYGNWHRDTFLYGHISPLVARIHRLIDDPQFTGAIDVGTHASRRELGQVMSLETEQEAFVKDLIGDRQSTWTVHIVDVSHVAADLLQHVLAPILESVADVVFRRGPEATYPTLLVLEEAHHYLRELSNDSESGKQGLAYERVAKEGRKYGLSLWISTQRPVEVSPTVLGQCGTWVVFRLIGEEDLRAVGAASEWGGRREIQRISGLPRQHALIFGVGVPVPVEVEAPTANPRPKSGDPRFREWAQPPVR